MLPEEARWLKARLERLGPGRLSPLLNVGSSTAAFRQTGQPWIEAEVFAPLAAAGVRVVHQDLKAAPGVDLVGDLLEPSVLARVRAEGVRSVLLSNVLEHVPAAAAFSDAVASLVAPGGALVVTVPHRFPHHPDPIDTGFRPTPAQLAGLFPGLTLEEAEVVPCGSLWTLAARGWRGALRRRLLERAPAGAPGEGGKATDWLFPWLWEPFSVTCAVFAR